MGILDLPTELLVLIVELTRPSDLDSLGLSCKTIAKVGKETLRRHRSYKRQWKHIDLNDRRQQGREPQTALALILSNIQDRRIAEYIETLDLRYYSDEVDVESGIKSLLADKGNEAALERLVTDSPYPLSNLWSRESWEDDRHSQNPFTPWTYEELTTAVLLSLLPNVRTLRLPDQWHETQYSSGGNSKSSALRRVLDAIVSMANKSSQGEAPLSSLETILPYSETQYDPRNGLCEVLPFMSLKSLQNLHVCNMVGVDDGYTGIPFLWYHGDIASCLRTIQLPGGCMDAAGVAELVRHTPQLTTFAYSHHTKWHGCLHDWGAGSFIAAIGEHRGDTITELAITIDLLFGMIENGVTSLKEFKRLNTVELDVRVFAGPSVASGNRQGMEGEFTAWEPSSVPNLLDILPPTICTINLFVSDDEGEVDEKQCATVLGKFLGELSNDFGHPVNCVVRSNRKGDELQEIRDLVSSRALARSLRWNERVEQKDKPMWQEQFIERYGEIFK
ncbi:hypothetical protein LTR78_000954 [Recurvomyces mirabilis]|uniref:F-box domain-containing protein n=1 Tax=Recurvomyces mirabilis TaxID=574656 RepID=A0AAE0WWY1_9PEZI|nr:hypothetical protein LTR78_000954 [Recurvomyces mirabilis]KAK5158926.1 hypothetical protein LTS14_003034 [Recurvomyces mirabilis]